MTATGGRGRESADGSGEETFADGRSREREAGIRRRQRRGKLPPTVSNPKTEVERRKIKSREAQVRSQNEA